MLAVVLGGGCGHVDFDGDPPCPALFCDGFETGTTSRWSASDVETEVGATQHVTEAVVHSGQFALDGVVPPGTVLGMFSAVEERVGVRSSGVLAVRLWVYSPSPLATFNGPLLVHNLAQTHQLLVSGNTAGQWDLAEQGGNFDYPTTIPTAAATWTCIELDYTFGPPATFELDIDDAVAATGSAQDTPAVYDTVDIGVARSSLPGVEIIVDDAVISLQPHIGCY